MKTFLFLSDFRIRLSHDVQAFCAPMQTKSGGKAVSINSCVRLINEHPEEPEDSSQGDIVIHLIVGTDLLACGQSIALVKQEKKG